MHMDNTATRQKRRRETNRSGSRTAKQAPYAAHSCEWDEVLWTTLSTPEISSFCSSSPGSCGMPECRKSGGWRTSGQPVLTSVALIQPRKGSRHATKITRQMRFGSFLPRRWQHASAALSNKRHPHTPCHVWQECAKFGQDDRCSEAGRTGKQPAALPLVIAESVRLLASVPAVQTGPVRGPSLARPTTDKTMYREPRRREVRGR